MKTNKSKSPKKEAKSQPPLQTPHQFSVQTKEQKIKELIESTNHHMYQSLSAGNLKINEVDKIAKRLIKQKYQSVFQQIINGHLEVSSKSIPYNLPNKKLSQFTNFNQQIQDSPITDLNDSERSHLKMFRINSSLKALHDSMKKDKQLQKNQSLKLRQKAKSFISKVQKEKSQFQEKLKNKKSSSRLFIRAYSEDTIRIMKDKLTQKVQQKKEKIAEKLKMIQKRKAERLQSSVNAEVCYWQKVKEYQSCKNLKKNELGQSFLPEINNPSGSSSNKRYESLESKEILSRMTKQGNNESVLSNKFDEIDKYVLRAKLKMHEYQNKAKKEELKSQAKILQLKETENFQDLYVSSKSYHSNRSLNPERSINQLASIDRVKKDFKESQTLKPKTILMTQNNLELSQQNEGSLKSSQNQFISQQIETKAETNIGR